MPWSPSSPSVDSDSCDDYEDINWVHAAGLNMNEEANKKDLKSKIDLPLSPCHKAPDPVKIQNPINDKAKPNLLDLKPGISHPINRPKFSTNRDPEPMKLVSYKKHPSHQIIKDKEPIVKKAHVSYYLKNSPPRETCIQAHEYPT